MSRVVLALGSGEVDVPGFEPLSRVNYLIFERAERDARHQRDLQPAVETAWALRSLHQVATGLLQLHRRQITHQDLKPSNVLVFEDESSKVGDLGQASWVGHNSPWDGLTVAGDSTYAPPELLYGHVEPDSIVRRRAADMYQLGGICLFLFCGVATTGALTAELESALQWGNWTLGYREVVPYLVDAFDHVVRLLEDRLPTQFQSGISAWYRELANPDIAARGDPKTSPLIRQRFALDRYVSRIDLFARQAELGIRRVF
jgi:serine/threonine protein kinase